MSPTATTHHFVVPPDALASLGAFAATLGELSVLSDSPPDAATTQELIAAGALAADGSVATEFTRVLDILAAPRALAQVSVTGGGSLIDMTVQQSAAGSVSTSATPEGLVLTSPADADSAVRLLTEHLGFSMLSSLTVAVKLDPTVAMVFAATVDHFRRRMLGAFLAGKTDDGRKADQASVREMLDVDDPRWFAPIVRALTGLPAESAAGDVGNLTPGVEQAAAQVARRFMLFDRVVTVAAATVGSDGEPTASQVVCVQAGVHDVLIIEPGPDGVSFVALPAALALSRMAAILDDPARELGASVADSSASVAPFCTQCGAPLLPGTEFCTKCGTHRAG